MSSVRKSLWCLIGLHEWRTVGPVIRMPRTHWYYAKCRCARADCGKFATRRI